MTRFRNVCPQEPEIEYIKQYMEINELCPESLGALTNISRTTIRRFLAGQAVAITSYDKLYNFISHVNKSGRRMNHSNLRELAHQHLSAMLANPAVVQTINEESMKELAHKAVKAVVILDSELQQNKINSQ